MSALLTLDELDRIYDEVDLANEQRDACGEDFLVRLEEAINSDGGEPHPDWKAAVEEPLTASARIVGGGKKLKTIKGMGTVYDWRHSLWTPANGGTIHALLGIQHIPVIRNVNGIADFVTLRNVLVAQDLMVQNATDREGNVGLFAFGNHMCFHARGANSLGWGTEHMHLTITEPWTKRQLRASAWVNQLNRKHYGTPSHRATLRSGDGIVRVVHGGQDTHMNVSKKAGYNDRIDPDGGKPGLYDFEYVAHCEVFFAKHGHFEGA